jgi:hypothetical protein
VEVTVLHKINTGKAHNFCLLLFSYLLSAIITALVYYTGGTSKVYANLMYIPIAIVASNYGKIHGAIHAIISALFIGPFMPLNTYESVPQDTINWILRTLIYATIGLVLGLFSDYHRQEFEKNSKMDKEIAEAQTAMTYSLVKLAESRDDYTGGHIERVAGYCRLIAQKLRSNKKYKDYINDDYIENIYKASPLHDIGKVGIPDSILLKPGKLNTDEFEIMKKHTIIGANTLMKVRKGYPDNKYLGLGISITLYHHERWDGTGYPQKLSGEDIPLSARIMAIADVYDALRSKRVYKEPYSHEKSVEIIKEGKGTQFDPDIVDVFLENEAEFERTYERFRAVDKHGCMEIGDYYHISSSHTTENVHIRGS